MTSFHAIYYYTTILLYNPAISCKYVSTAMQDLPYSVTLVLV